MKEPKLLRQIKNLSPEELLRFKDFVNSPFFNQHLPTSQLFDFIYNQLPDIVRIDKAAIFEIIYGEAPFKAHKINNLMSCLMSLLEQFHAQLIFGEKKLDQSLYSLEYCYKRNQTELFKSQQLKIKKELSTNAIQDSQYYYDLHRFYQLNDYFALQQGSRKQEDFLHKQVEAFDAFYLSEKLKYSCDMLSRMNVLNKAYQLDFLEELLAYLNQNWEKYEDIASIKVYHAILMTLMESENESYYAHLKDLLLQYRDCFSTEEAQLLYDYAQNYCIKKINQGKSSYLQEIFHLYKQLISSGLILRNDLLSEWDYKNIVTVGCRLGDFEWTEGFIQRFKDHLSPKSRENAYTYNLASFYYSTRQYESALLLLQKLDFTDVYYHLGAKFIQCKIYYELEETEALLSLLDTFRIYILRNKSMAKKQQQAPLNFIRFTKKLTMLFSKKDVLPTQKFEKQCQKLKVNIEQAAALVNMEWLLEKLALLNE